MDNLGQHDTVLAIKQKSPVLVTTKVEHEKEEQQHSNYMGITESNLYIKSEEVDITLDKIDCERNAIKKEYLGSEMEEDLNGIDNLKQEDIDIDENDLKNEEEQSDSPSMFYLIKFAGTHLEIYPGNKIMKGEGNRCIVRCEGEIVASSDVRELLLKQKEEFAENFNSTPEDNLTTYNVNSTITQQSTLDCSEPILPNNSLDSPEANGNNGTCILTFDCAPGEIVDLPAVKVFSSSTLVHESTGQQNSTDESEHHSSANHCAEGLEASSANDNSLVASINVPGLPPCNDSNMFVQMSSGRDGSNKRNFCGYCHTKQLKIARHLEIRHKNEEDVKKFIELPKGSVERRRLIDVIRKRGNYIFNTNNTFNDGELIVSRRPQINSQKGAQDFKACGNCKAYFSKSSLRAHFAKCRNTNSKKQRIAMIASKQVMGRVHARASRIVREILFPPLREDRILRLIRYDELIILYANKMTEKYKHARHFEIIRQRMRLMGRFLARIKEINTTITDFTSVFDPKNIDDTARAINIEAGLDERTNSYKTPTVAFSLGTLLKQTGNILINDSIKKHADEVKINVEDYLKLLREEVVVNINRDVAETQLAQQRREKAELPSKEDSGLLHGHSTTQGNDGHLTLFDTKQQPIVEPVPDEIPKRKRLTSPYGNVKRRRWSEEEKSVIFEQFKEQIRAKKLPSLKNIQEVLQKNPCLQRTSVQVKTWISNQYKSKTCYDDD